MMRRLLGVSLSLTLMLVSTAPLVAQEPPPPPAWEPTSFVDRGFILGMVAHPDGAVFVRSPGKLTRSDDQGASWQDVPLPPQAPTWRNIPSAGGFAVAHPTDSQLIYATGQGGVWRSVDGGATWAPAFPLPGEGPTWSLLFSQPDGGTIYREVRDAQEAATSSISRSDNGGQSWNSLPPVADTVSCAYLAFLWLHPSDSHRLFGGSRCGIPPDQVNQRRDLPIWQSRDGGATWTALFTPEEAVTVIPSAPRLAVPDPGPTGLLYALVNYHLGPLNRPTGTASAVYRSDDDGATWQRRGVFAPRPDDPGRTSVAIADLVVDPRSPDRLYLVLETLVGGRPDESPGRSGVLVSTDGGASWTTLGNPSTSESSLIKRLVLGKGRGTGYLFAASSDEVWRLRLEP